MKRLMLPFLMVWMTFFSQNLFAQAADDASDTVYNTDWITGDNGGDGFGAWILATSGNAGHFSESSTNNGFGDGNGDGDINTDGRAWGLYANSGGLSEAIRLFSTALVSGQRFTISMDNGDVQSGSNQTVGFGLQNSSGENLFEFYFRGGANYYDFNDLDGQKETTVSYTDEGVVLNFTLTSSNQYLLTVEKLEDSSIEVFEGTLKNPAGGQSINQIRLFNANAGPDPFRNLYFNSLSVQTDANRPTVELANVSGTVANATLLDSKAGDLGIVRIEVKQLQDATLTVDGNAANLNDVIAKQLVSSVPVSVTATGAEPQVRLLITDVAGNETVWFFDFLNM